MKIASRLESLRKPLLLGLGFALIGAIGFFDFLTGFELSFSIFYVLPISFITWFIGRRPGLAASLIGAIVWLSADLAAGQQYSFPLIPIWNSLIRFAFFVIISVLLSALQGALRREGELARIDYLTGAVNGRFFYYLAQLEIDRCQRYHHPFTLVYIDLDNFKAVNDQFGHAIGDQALRAVASIVKSNLRKTDVIARLGGDEFAILLPETDQEFAFTAVGKVQQSLLTEMRKHNWPVTFSIGVMTFNQSPSATDELVKMADDLMYSVKRNGKNAIKHGVYTG